MLAGAATGLYGHVEQNHKRSLLLFGGFIVAIELMALVALFLPTMVYDYGHNALFSPLGYLKRYVAPVALVGLSIYAVKLWWFVGGVQKSVGFRYVDNDDEPRFCRILEPLAIAAGIRTPFAAVIDSPALNAFACGVRANHMVVVATRGLIDRLDDDELAAVLAHEIIHIRNRDTLLLASANTFLATLRRGQGKRPVKLDQWRQAVSLVILPILFPIVLLIAFLTELALRIGYCSRAAIGSAREYIADAEAVRLTKNPAAMVSALRKIEGRSRIDSIGQAEEAMMIDGPVEGPLATHPTVTERIAALARTTGSMVFEGGTRLDTRAEPVARAVRTQSFGRRDEALLRIATLAEAPPRATLWEIFRKTRDPERNLFGFNRRAMLVLGTALAAVALIASTGPGMIFFRGQTKLVYVMGDASAVMRQVAVCEFQAMRGALGKACSGNQLDRQTDKIMARLGLPATSSAALDEAYERKLTDVQLRNHCYYNRFDMTPAALTGPPQGRWPSQSLDELRESVAGNNDSILRAPPGAARDAALRDYVVLRQRLLNDSLFFYGKPAMDGINDLYRQGDHGEVIALLGQRMRDPAFTAHDKGESIANYRLFASVPFDLLPCDVVAK